MCQQEDDTRSDANSDFDVGSDEGEDNDVERDASRSARCGASDVAGARGAGEAMHDTSVVMVSTTMSVAPVDIIHGSSDNAATDCNTWSCMPAWSQHMEEHEADAVVRRLLREHYEVGGVVEAAGVDEGRVGALPCAAPRTLPSRRVSRRCACPPRRLG